MKALRGILTLFTVLGGMTTVALTIHGLNPRIYRWLPEDIQQFMSDYDWIKWVAAGVLVVSVLLNLATERALKSRARES
jgi:hypothetical protein